MTKTKFNPYQFRKQFKWFKNNPQWVNFDNAATSIALDTVSQACKEYYELFSVNPHNKTPDLNNQIIAIIAETRQLVADWFNVTALEIIFTSSATESINLFAHGLKPWIKPGDEIVLKGDEHSANVLPWVALAKQTKARLVWVEKQANQSLEDTFKSLINPKTKVVAITATSNLFGNSIDFAQIADYLKQVNPKAFVAVDAVQTVQHKQIDIAKTQIDFLAFSTHKFYGPTGLGVAYIKKSLQPQLQPLKLGGDIFTQIDPDNTIHFKSTPLKFEAGTPNIMAIYALNKLLRFFKQKFNFAQMMAYGHQLKQQAYELLNSNPQIVLANHDQDVPIFSFKHRQLATIDLATFLNINKIMVRQGSICVGRYRNKDYFVRVSLMHYNTVKELQYLAKLLATDTKTIIKNVIK
ncbi:cysteine desulfurase [Mycoplasmoides pneumoniae]|uniref:Probable cysteine desulfurase n=1 Tax=Mycoplasma pneumoniae (strain ATCC 29342 / M129 / Subtype 1) TaxID=272634 RepID=CSD_MYCPN|nr:cysteine desulfurase [Mycoplasmoides pneumoniae]P75298.1 RecName: Full=Probable cysteine desulfurase [Mycoplasmoides pneumoniae M129]AAB96003.1 NifS [Mycoplasmoides pneumoniae M129]AGC04380.1 cysteine desulfurase [Mycoplasmoides pneumoniae M129-B7]ALA30359.1 cysteine desulfurase [Mycoplasmoides pneumoniae PI 1428]ALA32465.1 cysteine desulfurase [Mycoplasmoides pneumoniae 51494]ALA33166.1 cysteine desulfurase [Mycoplasmoides pneumoniae 54089]